MAFTNVWDDNFPPDTQAANQLGADLRKLRVDVRERLSMMSGNDGDKANFESGFVGALYFATDTGKIYRWNGSTWQDVTTNIVQAVTPETLGLADVATSGDFGDMLNVGNMLSFRTETVSAGTANGNYFIAKFQSDAGAKFIEIAFGTGEAKQGDTVPLPGSFNSSDSIMNAFYKRSSESAGAGLDNISITTSGLQILTCFSDRVSDGNQTANTFCGWVCVAWRQV